MSRVITSKSRRQPGRESKKGQRYSHGIWIAWTPVNQQWFLLQGKGPNDSIILDRFMTRAEAARAAERLTEKRGDENPWNESNRDFAIRTGGPVTQKRRDPVSRRVLSPRKKSLQSKQLLSENEKFFRIQEKARLHVREGSYSKAIHTLEEAAKRYRGSRRGKLLNEANDLKDRTIVASKRDPNGKVTNLAAFRKKKEAVSMSRETQAYEQREVADFQRQLREVEKLPLRERKENALNITEALHNEPELVAERVGWLLNGSYGRGAYTQAQRVARSPRMNQSAWLVQTVAALEWSVPPRMTAQAWHTLSAGSRRHLESLIQREIRDALSE